MRRLGGRRGVLAMTRRQVRLIRRGATRTVLLVGPWAVKVPSLRGVHPGGARGRLASFARGLLANQSEAVWHDYAGWQGQVAPVLASWLLGVVQVYPRCEPVPVDDLDRYCGDVPLPVLVPSPGDVKSDNFGLLNGRLVFVDYDMS